ncbi:hypothetical protein AB6A23_22905 [Paenibacillus tarimensis]
MRNILMSVVLLAAVVALYLSVYGGEAGTEKQVRNSGSAMSGMIRGIDP